MVRKIQTLVVLVSFFFNLGLPSVSFAQSSQEFLNLPVPGKLLSTSPSFTPALIKGLKIDPKNALGFNFIVDTGDTNLTGEALKEESNKMIKYFLAALTVPEKDLWVNLSPYEKDRIIAGGFGQTEMGRDMLGQDYVLKQLTASLIYPESQLGKTFWAKVYRKAEEQFGSTNIPVNTFNKVWIVPDHAVIYEHNGTAFVVENKLKVMLEEDYLSLQKHMNNTVIPASSSVIPAKAGIQNTSALGSQVIREVLIPEIEKEVNTGKNFATLRQIANATVLAAWYKQALKESLLGKIYADKNKINGVESQDKNAKMKIYNQYLQAFKKGVFNYIKEEPIMSFPNASVGNPGHATIARKYFSGGTVMDYFDSKAMTVATDAAMTPKLRSEIEQMSSRAGHVFSLYVETTPAPAPASQAMVAEPGSFEAAVQTKRMKKVGYNMKGELKTAEVDEFVEGIVDDYLADPVDLSRTEITAFFAEGDLKQVRQTIDQLMEVYKHRIPQGFIKLGAQNIRKQGLGAYTAHAPSIDQILDWKVESVLLGHSEIATPVRGEPSYVEPDELIAEKARLVIDTNAKLRGEGKIPLKLTIAFGETKDENDAGKTEEVLRRQISVRLSKISAQEMVENDVTLAYEPVWAIGKGAKSAPPEVAEEYVAFSRKILFETKGYEAAAKTSIEYGGNVNKDNVIALSEKPNIDGGLIGGASKKWDTAAPIYRQFAAKANASQAMVADVVIRDQARALRNLAWLGNNLILNAVKSAETNAFWGDGRVVDESALMAAIERLKDNPRQLSVEASKIKPGHTLNHVLLPDNITNEDFWIKFANNINAYADTAMNAADRMKFSSNKLPEDVRKEVIAFYSSHSAPGSMLYLEAARKAEQDFERVGFTQAELDAYRSQGKSSQEIVQLILHKILFGDEAKANARKPNEFDIALNDTAMVAQEKDLSDGQQVTLNIHNHSVTFSKRGVLLDNQEEKSAMEQIDRVIYYDNLFFLSGGDRFQFLLLTAKGFKVADAGIFLRYFEERLGFSMHDVNWSFGNTMLPGVKTGLAKMALKDNLLTLTPTDGPEFPVNLENFRAFVSEEIAHSQGSTAEAANAAMVSIEDLVTLLTKMNWEAWYSSYPAIRVKIRVVKKGATLTVSYLERKRGEIVIGNDPKELLAKFDELLHKKVLNLTDVTEDNLKALKSTVDKAAVAQRNAADPLGGINLDPAMYSIQIRRDGRGIPLPVDQQPVDKINISGLDVKIMSVTPADLPLMLGIAQTSQALAMGH